MKQSVLAILRKQRAKKALIISAEDYYKNWKQGEVVASGVKRISQKCQHQTA